MALRPAAMPSSADTHTHTQQHGSLRSVPLRAGGSGACRVQVCVGLRQRELTVFSGAFLNPSETLKQNQFRFFGGFFHPLLGTASPPSEVCVCPAESPTCPCSAGTRQGSWAGLPPAHQSPRRLGSRWGTDRRSITSSSLRHQGQNPRSVGRGKQRPPG